jgi:hypothetical protein
LVGDGCGSTYGLPRGTVAGWLAGRTPGHARGLRCALCLATPHRFDALPPAYVYLLGLYLEHGTITPFPRGVYRLRVFLDLRYPSIIAACEAAISTIAPTVSVNRHERGGSLATGPDPSNVEVYAYSKTWPCLFPQHGPGRKHERSIVLVDWQSELVARDPELLLRGLIHSDGCRFIYTGTNWRHPRYSFSNRSEDILGIFRHACDLLGLRYTLAPRTVYVSRKADVARMDGFIGPKT